MNWRAFLRRPSILAAVFLLVAIAAVWGITAAQNGQAKSLDQRTYDVASQLVCPVCNGESVADASSATAQEYRRVIRQQLTAGKSEEQVIAYFQAHYGDTVLESPPRQGFTALIWVAPLLMLLAGLYLLVSVAREWRSGQALELAPVAATAEPDDGLTDEQRVRLRNVLRKELDADEGYAPGRGWEGA